MQENAMISQKPKMNVAILIMQCIGIIAVVYGHASSPADKAISNAFEYYSWHMPFFVFISGYLFNRTRSAGKYITQKLKTHLLPGLAVNAVFCIFAICLRDYGVVKYVGEITWKNFLILPFTTGYSAHINVAMWFLFVLVIIEIVACVMDRLARGKADFIYLMLSLFVSCYCVYRTFYFHDETREEYLNAVLRFGYLYFFFWLGICYRRYGEGILKRFINWKTSIVIYLVQLMYLAMTGYNLTTNIRNMIMNSITVPDGWWTALVAPMTATFFYLGIAYSLEPYLQGCKTLEKFGRSTKYIMYYHQLVFVLFSVTFAVLDKLDIYTLDGFKLKTMQKKNYYSGGNELMTYAVAAISMILPVIVCRFLDKQKWYIKGAAYVILSLLIIIFFHWAGDVINDVDAKSTTSSLSMMLFNR